MITVEQFSDAWQHAPLDEKQREAILGVYSFPNHEATAPQLAALMNLTNAQESNLRFGGGAHVIADFLNYPKEILNDKGYWVLIISAWDHVKRSWTLLPEFVAALDRCSTVDQCSFDPHADDITTHDPIYEGAIKIIPVSIYERSAAARRVCVAHYGCVCVVCGFSFVEKYGALGEQYIHVHHLVPLSMINDEYVVDPVQDLRPVCPNCHAMLHRSKIPLSIEELKDVIQKQNHD